MLIGTVVIGQLVVDMFKQVFIEREDEYHIRMVTVKLYLEVSAEFLQSLHLDGKILDTVVRTDERLIVMFSLDS